MDRISSFKEAARPATACNFVMVLNLVPLQVMPQELTAWNFSTVCSDASGVASGASSGASSGAASRAAEASPEGEREDTHGRGRGGKPQ